jgi:Tfp pilus assembly protein PilN/Tfp pilus assembly PilM family ATPase
MIYLKTSIGIELQSEDMLLSSLQGNLSGATFSHYRRIPAYRTRDSAELRQEIQLFLRNNVLGKDNIIVGIPRRDVLLRHLDLPAEVADNLKQVIQYQVQAFEPTEEDSYYYDYVLLGKTQKNKRLSVLLAMVRKNLLDSHLQFLFDLGVQPAAITCSTIALTNLFLQYQKEIQDKTYILAEVRTSSLELLVLDRGIPVYSSDTPKGNMDWKELVLKEISEAASRIRLGPDNAIEQIILAGEASEPVYQELKTDIAECVLIKDAVPVKSNDETRSHVQEAATAVGLAFTGLSRQSPLKFNLIPQAFRSRQAKWAYATAAILGIVILLLGAGIRLQGPIQNRALAKELDQQIAAQKEPVEKVMDLRKQAEDLAREINALENLYRKKDKNLEILEELTNVLPEDTYLTNYRYADGTITIGGYSNAASDLTLMLESSPLFKEVGQKGAFTRDRITGKERFTIEAKLEE